MKFRNEKLIGLSVLFAAGAIGLISFVELIKRDERVASAEMDVYQAATWEATDGGSGTVSVLVLDECAKAGAAGHAEKSCPAAIRAVIRFYLDLGGEYGCTQAVRALSLYRDLGDDLSRSVAAKCAKEQR